MIIVRALLFLLLSTIVVSKPLKLLRNVEAELNKMV
jgi:hypothetical protein